MFPPSNRIVSFLVAGPILIGMLFWPVQIASASPEAQTIRVAPFGSDFASCGSEAQPCATLQYAANKAFSGDTILVATGTYTYSGTPLSPVCYTATTHPSVVCIIDKHLTLRGGYAAGNWSKSDPLANPTILDGQNYNRGVSLLGTNAGALLASLTMEGFTIQNGLAQGAASGADYQIGGYGAGMFVNNGSVALKHVIFHNNLALGGNTNTAYGGAGVGAGLAINQTPAGTVCTLNHVTFDGNEARGGWGTSRGGSALGGGFYVYYTLIQATDVTLTNNIARAGSTNGSGYDGSGLTADGLGGGATIHGDADATLQRLVATGNQAIGGSAVNGQAGHGQGGALFAEMATVLTVLDSTLNSNHAIGGTGKNGGIGGGGAVISAQSAIYIDRTIMVANTAIGGTGSTLRGGAGGGALYLIRFFGTTSIGIHNSLIADNYIEMGSGPGNPGGGGGGIWAQGVDLTITHTTFAKNRMEANLAYGIAAIFVNFGAPTPTVTNISHSIISDHQTTNPNYTQPAIYTWSGNTVNFNRGLLAANSANFGGTGTVNGLATLTEVPSVGYVAPGAPYYNYHIQQASPGRDQAVGSTTHIDIDLNDRPENGIADFGVDEYTPFALSAANNNTSARLNWGAEAGQLIGTHHYEIIITCEAGANPPDQGACNTPLQMGSDTSFSLTGLTNFKHYTATVYAKDAGGVTIATSNSVDILPTDKIVYLPTIHK